MKLFKILSSTAVFVSLSLASINLNTASKDELMALPGIGEAKAEAIIEYRKNNKFNSIDEIKNIKGIGDKRFEAIKDDLTLTGKTDTSDLKSTVKKEKEKATKKADKKVKKEIVDLKDKVKNTDTAKKAKKAKDTADEAKKIKKAVSE